MIPLSQPAAPDRGPRWKAWLAPLADAVVAVTLLRGVTAHGGRPATMLVAGRVKRVGWLVDRFFAGPPEREPLGHVPAWRLGRTLRQMKGSADLTVAHVARLSARPLGFGDDYLPVPDWIGMRFVAPFHPDAPGRPSHSLSDDLRRVRRGQWSAEVSHRASDFAAFYREMYVPYVRNRHSANAYVQPARRLRRAFRRGGLLWLSRDGERRQAAAVAEDERRVRQELRNRRGHPVPVHERDGEHVGPVVHDRPPLALVSRDAVVERRPAAPEVDVGAPGSSRVVEHV